MLKAIKLKKKIVTIATSVPPLIALPLDFLFLLISDTLHQIGLPGVGALAPSTHPRKTAYFAPGAPRRSHSRRLGRRDARRATMTSKSAGGVIAVAAGQPVMSVRVDFYLLDVAFPALCLSAGECPLAF
jgi:hypothetical protein